MSISPSGRLADRVKFASEVRVFLKNAGIDSPAEINLSILSLKGCRFSSAEFAHTFCTSFSHTGREEEIIDGEVKRPTVHPKNEAKTGLRSRIKKRISS